MTAGLERVPNDEVTIEADTKGTETIRRAEPVIAHAWGIFLIDAQQVPLRMWMLLLLASIIVMASEALTVEGSARHSAPAKPLPLLLMMTEKPERHISP